MVGMPRGQLVLVLPAGAVMNTDYRLVLSLLCPRCKGTGVLYVEKGKGVMPEQIECEKCSEFRREVLAEASLVAAEITRKVGNR